MFNNFILLTYVFYLVHVHSFKAGLLILMNVHCLPL